MHDFQRAVSDGQRARRRQQILSTCATLLGEMPVAQVSLNELARRTGLSKSSVLRYFESREALLLTLLLDSAYDMITALPSRLSRRRRGTPWDQRLSSLCEVIADELRARPILCDLLSAQSMVLERNISTETAADHKRAIVAANHELADIVRTHLPELDPEQAQEFARVSPLVAAAIWPVCNPAPALAAAYAAHPELATMRMEFAPSVERFLATYLRGMLSTPQT